MNNINKLFVTSGLVSKKVLVRKKGSKPFWSTRWIQPGQDVKDVVRGLGYEVVEEEPKREPTGRVHLQGWMDSPSITADTVRVGDVRLFNNGEDKIINIEEKTAKTLIFTYEEKDRDGNHYTQNVRKTTKIVIKELYEEARKKYIKDYKKRELDRKKKLEDQKKKVIINKPEPKVTVKPEPKVTVKKQSTNDLKHEIVKLKNKIYYAKLRDDFDVIPEYQKQIEVLEAKIKEIDDKPRELIDVDSDFVSAKTKDEAIDRLNKFISIPTDKLTFKKYGLNLEGLKLKDLNSIINGFEKSFAKYGIKLSFIGWNEKKQTALAQYYRVSSNYQEIKFQKTATKNVIKTHKKNINQFDANKIDRINQLNRYLTYPEIEFGGHDKIRDQIIKKEACNRWTVDSSTNDPLSLISSHEGHHAIYFQYKLESKWKDNLKVLVGDDMNQNIKCASVSEYGMSSVIELFAEVGAAVSFGVEIDKDVKQAYLNTIAEIKK